MFPLIVVKLFPGIDAKRRLGDQAVSIREDLLVLQAAPSALDEDVVQKSAFAIVLLPLPAYSPELNPV